MDNFRDNLFVYLYFIKYSINCRKNLLGLTNKNLNI